MHSTLRWLNKPNPDERRPFRIFFVETYRRVRTLKLFHAPNSLPDSCVAETELGRYFGQVTVTADKRSICSAIRERVDKVEKRHGVRLIFIPEDVRGKEFGNMVTMRCYLYEPENGAPSVFGAFKRE